MKVRRYKYRDRPKVIEEEFIPRKRRLTDIAAAWQVVEKVHSTGAPPHYFARAPAAVKPWTATGPSSAAPAGAHPATAQAAATPGPQMSACDYTGRAEYLDDDHVGLCLRRPLDLTDL